MGNVKIVSASAGSGKTYNLAYEYVRNVVAEPPLYRHILAVTFTNKATEEMKRRILSKINDLACGNEEEYMPMLQRELGLPAADIRARAATVRSLILHDYGHFAVLTIDKFFQRIIRSFIRELGIDLNFNLELPVETLLGSAADRMIEEITSDDTLREWITAFVNDRIEDGRKWDIRGELLNLGGELFKEEYKRGRNGWDKGKEALGKIVAEATAQAARAKHAIMAPARRILDLAAENGLDISDFSNGRMGPAGYAAKIASGEITPYGKRVTDTIANGRWCTAKSPKKTQIEAIAPQLTELLAELAEAYDTNIRLINSASLLKENYRNFALLGDLQAKVAEVSKEENIVHISEINDMLARLISGNDTPFVFEKAGTYYSHFMIDEFQDTSAMQWENFLPLLRNATAQSETTPVMLVGDVKQSIYRWRGGDWSILARRAEEAFDHVVKTSLREHHRSRSEVVRFINAAVSACARSENDRIDALLDDAHAAGRIGTELRDELRGTVAEAYADAVQVPDERNTGGYVTVTYYGTERETATPPVVETVERLQERGYAAGDIAILVRRNSEATRIASMLLEHKRTHPESPYRYDVITQDALVIGRSPVVNFVISCLRLAGNPEDSIHRAIYNRFLGRGFGERLTRDDTEFLLRLRLMPPEEAFENTVMRYGLGCSDEDISYLQALHEQIIVFTKSNVADIPLFLSWWTEKGSTKSIPMPSGGNAITIDTIHRSKGLGYKAVIIPYCNWSLTTKTGTVVWSGAEEDSPPAAVGQFPVHYKKAMENSHFAADYYREYVMSHVDNLNLFYVALTRAREELHIMLPVPGRTESERIGTLLDSVISRSGGEARIGDACGKVVEGEEGFSILFGAPSGPSETKPVQPPVLPAYGTTDISGRLAVRFDSQRYAEEGVADDRLSPRNYGVLLHRLFEQADNTDDIRRGIEALENNGSVSAKEAATLRSSLDKALENDTVKAWFSGDWETVRNENDLLVPGGGGYRPDRVMIKEGRAVVVDYKFGLKRQSRYGRQVARYMELLLQMGYADVSGYIWYVGIGDIEPVQPGSAIG